MQTKDIEQLGDALFEALTECTTLAPLSSAHPGMTIDDAYAVQHAVKEGLRLVIITGGKSAGVEEAFGRLGVKEFFYHVHDKSDKLDELIAAGLDPSRAAYMGDDIPDLRVMERVALPCCPADAAEEVKAISRYISAKPGGMGCVRDLLEHRDAHPRARHPLPVVQGERGVVTLPPFDAFAVVGRGVEPLGSWPTLAAALEALGHFGDGGCVVVGLTLWRVHEDTDEAGRALLHTALAPHGVRGLEARRAPQWRAAA